MNATSITIITVGLLISGVALYIYLDAKKTQNTRMANKTLGGAPARPYMPEVDMNMPSVVQ
jgi:hypothetical protein